MRSSKGAPEAPLRGVSCTVDALLTGSNTRPVRHSACAAGGEGAVSTSACISCISSCSRKLLGSYTEHPEVGEANETSFASPCLLGGQCGHLLSAISAAKSTNSDRLGRCVCFPMHGCQPLRHRPPHGSCQAFRPDPPSARQQEHSSQHALSCDRSRCALTLSHRKANELQLVLRLWNLLEENGCLRKGLLPDDAHILRQLVRHATSECLGRWTRSACRQQGL